MSITFRCEHCRKEVQAPDDAAGKRGKCPYCKQSNYIPQPVSEDELLPLAPLDEEEERRTAREVEQLRRQESELIAEMGGSGEEAVPLEHREEVKAEDVHHHVVNYCLDMASSRLERAETHVRELKKFGAAGREAVGDFLSGRVIEPALDIIPRELLNGLLTQLNSSLK